MANQQRARASLERDLARLRAHPTVRPRDGWVRALRHALGMSAAELGRRVGVSRARIGQIERGEVDGTITLATLERVASALGARVEYALVPVEPLDVMVLQQGRRKAERIVNAVGHTMALEDQATAVGKSQVEIDRLAPGFVDRRGLWSGA